MGVESEITRINGAVTEQTALIQEISGILDGKVQSSAIKSLIERTVSEFVIPEGVQKIGSDAFYQCENLTDVKFPNSIEMIGDGAFGGCTKLTRIWISKNCTTISASSYSNAPFYKCANLKDIYTDATEKPSGWGKYFNYIDSGKQATIHYGVSKSEYHSLPGYDI